MIKFLNDLCEIPASREGFSENTSILPPNRRRNGDIVVICL
jgi:hypothetical protein